jgi:NAD(P)-dependent dehydrogenase (short-subunit alcohol dehydrogenase family)
VIAHDVKDAFAAHAAVNLALETFGRLDVVVNNAGYGRIQSIEESPEQALRDEIETNLMGVIHVTRAALPALRRQRSGHIFQVSSVGGRMGAAGFGGYAAAKWGVAGFSEVLAQEVAPFGVKVTVLEPGGMRTDFNATAGSTPPDAASAYAQSVDPIRNMLASHHNNEPIDPKRVAAVIMRLAKHPEPPMHLLLGSDSLLYVQPSETRRAAEAARWEPITRSVDFAADNAIPAFPGALTFSG